VRAVVFVAVVGCGGKAADSAGSHDHHGDHAASCGDDGVAVTPGLEVACASGDCTVEVVSTSPAPPDRGDNIWTFRVRDVDGAVLAVDHFTVSPFMPAHDHGTVPADFAGSPSADTWEVGPFDLFMPGLWELRLSMSADSVDHTAVIAFCVEG